jgi:hypothetical protein
MTEQKKTKKYRHYTYFSGDEASAQFACFQCRKVFKRRVAFYRCEAENQTCLKCGSEMWFTGTAFKAPRRETVKQLSKAELLIKNGILFYPNAGYRPKVLREVVRVLSVTSLGLSHAFPADLFQRHARSPKGHNWSTKNCPKECRLSSDALWASLP